MGRERGRERESKREKEEREEGAISENHSSYTQIWVTIAVFNRVYMGEASILYNSSILHL